MRRSMVLWACLAVTLSGQEAGSLNARYAEVQRLQELDGVDTESLLIPFLSDPAFTIRSAATRALERRPRLAPASVQALRRLLADECWEVRLAAVRALSTRAADDQQVADALIQTTLSDLCEEVRLWALHELWEETVIEESWNETQFLTLLADPSAEVREQAVTTLCYWENPSTQLTRAFVALLGNQDPVLAELAASALTDSDFSLQGWRMLARELVRYVSRQTDPQQRWLATLALRAQHPRLRLVVDLLLEMRGHPDPDVRLEVGYLLGELGETVPRALEGWELLDTDPEASLARLEDLWVPFDLLQERFVAFLRAPDPTIRQLGSESLDLLHGPELMQAAALLLADPDPQIRWATLDQLGELGVGPELDQLLTRCLADADLGVAERAAELLKKRGLPGPAPQLLEERRAQEPDSGLRSASFARRLATVEELPSDALDPLLAAAADPAWEIRREAAFGLAFAGEGAFQDVQDALAELVLDPSFETRLTALDALAELGSEARPLFFLIDRVARKDCSASVRLGAMQAAIQVDAWAGLPVLCRGLHDAAARVREETRELLDTQLLKLASRLPSDGDVPAELMQAIQTHLAELGNEDKLDFLARLCDEGGPAADLVCAEFLRAPDPALRRGMVEIARWREDRPAMSRELAARLEEETDPELVGMLARVLADAEYSCVAQLEQRLADPDPSVRAALLDLYERLAPVGRPLHERFLNDPDPAVREWARQTLD